MRLNKTTVDLIRAEKKMTSKEIWQRAGVSPNTLSVAYKRDVDPVAIGKIADALEVPVKTIIIKE